MNPPNMNTDDTTNIKETQHRYEYIPWIIPFVLQSVHQVVIYHGIPDTETCRTCPFEIDLHRQPPKFN